MLKIEKKLQEKTMKLGNKVKFLCVVDVAIVWIVPAILTCVVGFTFGVHMNPNINVSGV